MSYNVLSIRKLKFVVFLSFQFFIIGCHKEYLEVPRNKAIVIPSILIDFQALLDNSLVMNNRSAHRLMQTGTDEFILTDEIWDLLANPVGKNSYIWTKEIYEGSDGADWNDAYKRILYANIAIEGVNKIKKTVENTDMWNNIMGSALFFRSLAFYELSQVFCNVYREESADFDLGIPLRLESDINLLSPRSTLKETYMRILKDMEDSINFLPLTQQVKQRPTKQAAYAFLSRVYLQMDNYKDALLYANKTLEISNKLLNYNTLDTNLRYPFPVQGTENSEVIFTCRVQTETIVNSLRFDANPAFLDIYSDTDLRRNVFFFTNPDKRILFKGSYTGDYNSFTGLALDEVVLNSAECYVRIGDLEKAKEQLIYFKKNRYKINGIDSIETNNRNEILQEIFSERKKQFFRRGIRWSDLRRLNKEVHFEETMVRTLKNIRYELKPNDKRYVWPIPDNVINMSGIQQNER